MNACFLYALYKCKEIPEARALANKLVNESEKSKLPISESEMEYRRFPLRYLQACICFEDRNNLNEGLQLMYKLLRITEQQQEPLTFTSEVQKEICGLFSVIPIDPKQKVTMILLELTRVHTRFQDYRNAFKMCQRLAAIKPINPYILSRCGRFCLEIGRKKQAQYYFNMAQTQMAPGDVHMQI